MVLWLYGVGSEIETCGYLDRSWCRFAAIELNQPGPGADDFDPKRHIWDGSTWWTLDRRRWWDGYRWQPTGSAAALAAPVGHQPPAGFGDPLQARATGSRPVVQVTLSAGTAFKIGFFGAIGGVVASAVFWIALVVAFGSCLASLRTIATPTP
jgi:hypothetical protein